MGLKGLAFSTNASILLMLTGFELYSYLNSSIKRTYPGFLPDRRAFSNLGAFLKVVVPVSLSLVLRWWALELTIIFAGLFDATTVNSALITVNILCIFSYFPYALGMIQSCYISNLFGQGKVDEAKKFSRIA
mmetsp:Transcript_2801/g.3361  ORF Transcript_2801/g.3361 Transcript_2801/m.3361 type:complete len:132 (+) Transcript_2801:314-709(+)